jgi:hypothetical protein
MQPTSALARLVLAATLAAASACHTPDPAPQPFDVADLWPLITVAEAAGCDAIDYLHISHPPSGRAALGATDGAPARVVVTTTRNRIEVITTRIHSTEVLSDFLVAMLVGAGHRARAVTPSTVVVFLDELGEGLVHLHVEDDALAIELGRAALP